MAHTVKILHNWTQHMLFKDEKLCHSKSKSGASNSLQQNITISMVDSQ